MTWRNGAILRMKQESICVKIAVHKALKRAMRSWVQHSLIPWDDLIHKSAETIRMRRLRCIISEWRKIVAQRRAGRVRADLLESSQLAVSKAALLRCELFHWMVWLTACDNIKIGDRVKVLHRNGALRQGYRAWTKVMNIRLKGQEVRRMQESIVRRDRMHCWTKKVSERVMLLQTYCSSSSSLLFD